MTHGLWKAATVLDISTTVAEIVGALLISAGVFVCFGIGFALIVAGVLTIAGSYLVIR